MASSKHSNTTAPSNSTATPSSSTNFTMYGNFAEIATNSGREKLFNEWGLGHYFYLIVYGLIGTVQVRSHDPKYRVFYVLIRTYYFIGDLPCPGAAHAHYDRSECGQGVAQQDAQPHPPRSHELF